MQPILDLEPGLGILDVTISISIGNGGWVAGVSEAQTFGWNGE
jgi:hypothetical protein